MSSQRAARFLPWGEATAARLSLTCSCRCSHPTGRGAGDSAASRSLKPIRSRKVGEDHMSYRFAVLWLKAFRDSPEKVCDLYADDFLFEDLMLGQSITDKADLGRAFAPYANKDITNGVGVHLFRIDEYIGDENRGLIRWSWEAHGAAAFLGVPTNGKVVGTSGHTMHVNKGGKIKRESTYWDATSVLRDLGLPVSTRGVTAPRVGAAAYV